MRLSVPSILGAGAQFLGSVWGLQAMSLTTRGSKSNPIPNTHMQMWLGTAGLCVCDYCTSAEGCFSHMLEVSDPKPSDNKSHYLVPHPSILLGPRKRQEGAGQESRLDQYPGDRGLLSERYQP